MISKSRYAATWSANPFRALIAKIAWIMCLFPLLLLAVPAQSQSCTTISNSWNNSAFTAQTGTFTATVLATPSGSPINTVVGLSDGSASAYTHLAAIARFNPSGNIDAYNGGATAAYQAAATIPYTGGTSYLFEYDVNVAAQTYTVYVTPSGGTKTLVGQNFAFRLSAATLNNLGAYAEVGSDSVCSFTLSSGPTADFDWSISPASQTVTAGGSTTYTVTVNPLNGFSGTVSLAATGLPSGATATFSPASISGGSGTATLTVKTSSSTPAGSSTLTATGTSGSLTHSATASLGVTTVVSCNTASNAWDNTPFTGQTGTFTAMLVATPSGSPINTVIGLSDGAASAYAQLAAIARFNPSGDIDAYNGGSTAAYQAASTIPYTAGTSYLFEYDVNVAAQTYSVYVTPSGGAKTLVGQNFAFRLAAATLNNLGAFAAVGSDSLCNFSLSGGGTTPSFALSAAPSSQSVTAGGSTTYTATVTPSNGYSKTVTLSASGLPSGTTASFSPTSIAGGSGTSTLTLTTSTSTPANTYSITVGGTDGTLTSTASVSLAVSSGSSGGCAHGNGPLDPTKPPGCNFDLSAWQLQLPIGSTGNPTTITNPQLATFTDAYFQTGADGAMSFDDPGVNCVTTPNSTHCRSELGEVKSWSPTGTNTLSATLKVTNPAGAPVIGQIHLASSISVRPLVELYYNYKGNGHVEAGVEQCTAGGCENFTDFGPDPTGQFSYVISYSNGGQLTISINGGAPVSLSTPLLGDAGYFKAGDYGQIATDAAVSFYSLKIVHAP